MRTTALVLGLAAALTAGAASAQSYSAGHAQLAAQLGVDASAYTTGQLAALLANAREGDDAAAVGLGLGNTGVGVSRGLSQIAAQIGVEPGAFTPADLSVLKDVQQREGVTTDLDIAAAQLARADETPEVSAGQAQLAARLGLDPNDYTVAELTALYVQRFNSTD